MKSARLELRLTEESKSLLEAGAAALGQTVTAFVTAAAMEKARELVPEDPGLHLTREEAAAFVRILENDAPVTGALARGAKRYKKEFDEHGRRVRPSR